MNVELDPVDRITADATGDPGSRTFFLQAEKGEQAVTIGVEKEQVRLLAASILEILQKVGRDTDEEAVARATLELREPLEPGWRAGRLSIGYREDRDLLVLEVEELVPEEDDRVPHEVRLWATREQMLALARHGSGVVAAGRPLCPLCGTPMDPGGHWCPATNGHRTTGIA